MATNQTWNDLAQLRGCQVCELDEFDAKKKAAFTKRHSPHPFYMSIFKIPQLSEAESDAYATLHGELHSELETATQTHFRDTPIPRGAKWKPSPGWSFTPFTRQHLDWWKATYQVEIGVVAKYISPSLLQQLQTTLAGAFHDWCIYVRGCDGFDFDPQYDIYVFSDQILLPATTAIALKIPKKLWTCRPAG